MDFNSQNMTCYLAPKNGLIFKHIFGKMKNIRNTIGFEKSVFEAEIIQLRILMSKGNTNYN